MTKYFIELNGSEYLLYPLPPVLPERGQMIRIPSGQFDRFIENFAEAEHAVPVPHDPGSIFIRKNDSYVKIAFDRILWLEASRSYCTLHLDDSEMLVTFPMAEIARHLPAGLFLRIHRSFLINIRHVDSFVGNQVGIGKLRLPIGMQYREQVAACFEFLRVRKPY